MTGEIGLNFKADEIIKSIGDLWLNLIMTSDQAEKLANNAIKLCHAFFAEAHAEENTDAKAYYFEQLEKLINWKCETF